MTDARLISFQYTAQQIVAAQRSRLVSAWQVRLILGLGIAASVLVLVLDYTVGIPRARPVEPWVTGTAIGGVFMVVFFLLYFIAPHVDARLNPEWNSDFHFQVTPEFLYYGQGSSECMFRVAWPDITKAIENSRVYVLFLGSAMEFLVVPKGPLRAAGILDEFVLSLNSRRT
jgi:hypothetical protein